MFILPFLALMNNSEPERQTWFSTLSSIMQKADRMAQMDNSKRQKNKRKREAVGKFMKLLPIGSLISGGRYLYLHLPSLPLALP